MLAAFPGKHTCQPQDKHGFYRAGTLTLSSIPPAHAVALLRPLQLPDAQDARSRPRCGWRVATTLRDVEWIVSLIDARAPMPGPHGPCKRTAEIQTETLPPVGWLARAPALRYLAAHEPAEPLAPGRLLVGGCPEGFDARYLADDHRPRRRAGDACRARRCAAGGDAGGAALLRAGAAGAAPSRPGTACPTTASRRTPRSRRRGWRRWRRWPRGFDRPAAVLTTVNAATQRVPRARRCWRRRASPPRSGARLDVGGAARATWRGWASAGADRDRAGRVRGARRADRPLPAGRAGAGAARPVRRRAGERAAVRSRDPAHHREGRAGRAGAGVGGDPRRGGDPAVPHPLPRAFRRGRRDDPLYEAVSAGRKHQGFEHWLPFFHERLETLFDYLPGAPVLLDDQADAARAARWAALERAVRGAGGGAGGEVAARHRLQAGAAGGALPRRRGLGGGGRRAAAAPAQRRCRSRWGRG